MVLRQQRREEDGFREVSITFLNKAAPELGLRDGKSPTDEVKGGRREKEEVLIRRTSYE